MAKGKVHPVTWAQACRDITVAAINKGQLPVLGAFAVLLLVISRLPPTEVASFAHDLLDELKRGNLWGYISSPAILTAWLLHVRSMRKQFSTEYARIGLEKSALQSKAAGTKFKSSD